MRSRLVEIKKIRIDKKLYPRVSEGWQTSYDYSQKIKSGEQFPPIVLANHKKGLYLIDGLHRINAFKNLKEKFIPAIIKTGMTEKEIYIEAVKSNNKHGRPFSVQDKVLNIQRLKELRVSREEISRLVGVPLQELKKFHAGRIASSVTGETIVLKSAVSHLAGEELPADFEETNQKYYSDSQENIVKQFLNLLRDGTINLKDKKILLMLSEIKKELRNIK